MLDLNELVLNVNGLLARLIGEDIELVAELAPAVHAIEADSGQLEQVDRQPRRQRPRRDAGRRHADHLDRELRDPGGRRRAAASSSPART